jgi:hypothetical protein
LDEAAQESPLYLKVKATGLSAPAACKGKAIPAVPMTAPMEAASSWIFRVLMVASPLDQIFHSDAL